MTIYPSFNLKKISEYYFSKKNKELKFLEKKGNKIINFIWIYIIYNNYLFK
ncbi:MAG: hypothetical protein ACFS26_00880 [Candidatus Karelsulcia muelleri]